MSIEKIRGFFLFWLFYKNVLNYVYQLVPWYINCKIMNGLWEMKCLYLTIECKE